MLSMVFSLLAFGLVARFSLATPELITIYRPDAEDQEFSQILSASIIGFSAIDVVQGITDYAVSEVDTLFVIENSIATRTVFSTPVPNSYVIQRGSNFLGDSIFETITSPTQTFIGSGFAECTATVPQTPGGEVDCIEIEEFSGPGFSSGTTVGYKAILTPVFTLTQTESNLAGTPMFPSVVTIPTPTTVVNPSPTTTVGPTKTSSWAVSTYTAGTYLQVSLVATAIWILNFFILG